jgi:hypothetical protein
MPVAVVTAILVEELWFKRLEEVNKHAQNDKEGEVT